MGQHITDKRYPHKDRRNNTGDERETYGAQPYPAGILGKIDIGTVMRVVQDEEKSRIDARKTDPLKRWKLSDMDIKSLGLYDEYTKAKDEMLARTHSPYSPWIIVNSNDKKRARLNIIKDILSHIDYDGKGESEISLASDPSIVNLYSHLMHY